jgi:hypothetical protein
MEKVAWIVSEMCKISTAGKISECAAPCDLALQRCNEDKLHPVLVDSVE